MKKSLIALIISVIFLVACMFIVVKTKNNEKENIIEKNITVEYVDTNYTINFSDELVNNDIILNFKGLYIGNDEIIEEPKITAQVNCSYIYEDADQTFTNLLTDNVILEKDEHYLTGDIKLHINSDNVDSYSCYYKLIEAIGKYATTE